MHREYWSGNVKERDHVGETKSKRGVFWEVVCVNSVKWINVAQDRVLWHVVNTVIYLRVLLNENNLFWPGERLSVDQ